MTVTNVPWSEVTGQVDFDSHIEGIVEQVVALVNALCPGEARGRPYPPAADTAELRARAASARTPSYAQPRTDADVAGLANLADDLRTVFEAVAGGDHDTAATCLNGLMADHAAVPTLIRHDGEPWHLHFHGADAAYLDGIGGSMAVGLAYVLGGAHADRIGVCSAPACDRVYLDVSRNGTRRFCSTACQNRVKTAAFRRRQVTA